MRLGCRRLPTLRGAVGLDAFVTPDGSEVRGSRDFSQDSAACVHGRTRCRASWISSPFWEGAGPDARDAGDARFSPLTSAWVPSRPEGHEPGQRAPARPLPDPASRDGLGPMSAQLGCAVCEHLFDAEHAIPRSPRPGTRPVLWCGQLPFTMVRDGSALVDSHGVSAEALWILTGGPVCAPADPSPGTSGRFTKRWSARQRLGPVQSKRCTSRGDWSRGGDLGPDSCHNCPCGHSRRSARSLARHDGKIVSDTCTRRGYSKAPFIAVAGINRAPADVRPQGATMLHAPVT